MPLLAVLFAKAVASPLLLEAQERPTQLNYVNAPLTDVIRSLAVALGQNVVLSDVPDARVTFSTPIPVARQDLGQVLESILESHGLVLVQSGPLARVVPADKAPATGPIRYGKELPVLGTSDFYAVVEALPEVADSLVVHLEGDGDDGGLGELLLFVALAPGAELDDDLRKQINGALRSELSPRHVPDRIESVPAVPRTLSGKKLEVPVKRILTGTPVDQAASRGSLADPTSLDHFESLARR